MNYKDYEDLYENNINKVNEMKLKDEQKQELLKMLSEMDFQYNRLRKTHELNIKVYEEEKEILLQNFIKMYERGEKLNKELESYSKPLYRRIYDAFYNLLRKIYRKIRGR